jgi:uncharacterized protein YxjI
MNERFMLDFYLVRKKVFKIFGEAFHIYDASGNVILYSKQKAFKLREDIRLFTGEDMQEELLRISARQVLDFGASYDVIDSGTGQRVGTLRRKALRSILRDKWIILDAAEQEIGTIEEDNMLLALVRRFLTALIPQSFTLCLHGTPVADMRQRFNPFIAKLELDLKKDPDNHLDRASRPRRRRTHQRHRGKAELVGGKTSQEHPWGREQGTVPRVCCCVFNQSSCLTPRAASHLR